MPLTSIVVLANLAKFVPGGSLRSCLIHRNYGLLKSQESFQVQVEAS
jgi:hypothetical protein